LWGPSEEVGVAREDVGCGQPVVQGEKSEEVWVDSLVSVYQPERQARKTYHLKWHIFSWFQVNATYFGFLTM